MGDTRFTLRPVLVLAVLAALLMMQPDMGTTMIAGRHRRGRPAGSRARRRARCVNAGRRVRCLRRPARRARPVPVAPAAQLPAPRAGQDQHRLPDRAGPVGIATGRLFGVGLGAGREKTGFLPYAHTDFIFAIIGEEIGLIGCLVVVALFLGFVFLGVRTAARAPDRYGTLVATGVTAWILIQAFVNIGAVVGVLPVTGVPLPFVSFGGSSTVIAMAAVGMLANVAKQGRVRPGAPRVHRRGRHRRPRAARAGGRATPWSRAATTRVGHPLRGQPARARGRLVPEAGFP